jgi:hypothetical protein
MTEDIKRNYNVLPIVVIKDDHWGKEVLEIIDCLKIDKFLISGSWQNL